MCQVLEALRDLFRRWRALRSWHMPLIFGESELNFFLCFSKQPAEGRSPREAKPNIKRRKYPDEGGIPFREP